MMVAICTSHTIAAPFHSAVLAVAEISIRVGTKNTANSITLIAIDFPATAAAERRSVGFNSYPAEITTGSITDAAK